ncbi:MAG: sugar transferase [Atopobiaceae bacterium]|nr:sugar transferase [Atopobiaceae bacterium]
MNKRLISGFIKHGDFILLDVLCLQACYVLSYWINFTFGNPYEVYRYRYQALVMLASQAFVVLFSNNYHGIVRRSWFDELVATFTYIAEVFALAIVYLFAIHWVGDASRWQFGFTSLLFLVFGYGLRQLNKLLLRRRRRALGKKRSLVLVTSKALAADAVQRLKRAGNYSDFFIANVVLLDGTGDEDELGGMSVSSLDTSAMEELTHGWVDEILILQPANMPVPSKLMANLMQMGMTVSFSLEGAHFSVNDAGKIGPYAVLTSRIREISLGQMLIKRVMDIVGGFIGCVVTAIVALIIGPMIYAKSPGPVFFVQERVGRNGKTFKMYKFRSMYMDAEERKQELQSKNRINDGLMFKVDDDPRIIDGHKRNKKGKPAGIGHFIRRYSIDEFPQFLNVLRGEMSLVGTRPPTLDEWERYDMEHRVRMSIKPGITGLWQVSGRSKITEFEKVVQLDREYIENWNIGLDIKIMLKTVMVVIGGRGAL